MLTIAEVSGLIAAGVMLSMHASSSPFSASLTLDLLLTDVTSSICASGFPGVDTCQICWDRKHCCDMVRLPAFQAEEIA